MWPMAIDGSPEETRDDAVGLVTPRWLMPSLFTLLGLAAIASVLTGHVESGLILAGLILVTLIVMVVFRKQIAAFNRRHDAASEATYGSMSLFGVGWVALGVWRLATDPTLIVGIAFIAFGLLTVFAYAPAYFRNRSLARKR